MLHSFWCWVNRKSQEAIVKSARREMRKHMENKPESMDYTGPEWSRWYDRRDSLRTYLQQQTFHLNMIGGSVEKLHHSLVPRIGD